MAKANQFHRAGNTYRRVTAIKVPLNERIHNTEKWKARDEIKKEKMKKNKWWNKKNVVRN